MPITNPSVNERVLSALQDQEAELVCVGSRPRMARLLVRTLWSIGLYGVLGVGLFTVGAKVAESSGIAGELQSRIHPMQVLEPRPQQIQWLALPSSPFLEVARTNDGSYSINRLIGAYKAAGMTEEQGCAIVERLRGFSPVLMGAKDDHLAQVFRQHAFDTASSLQHDYPQFHERLVEMIRRHQTHVSYRYTKSDNPENWALMRRVWNSQGVSTSTSVEVDELFKVNFVQARQAIEQAALVTGVRALRIHPSNWSAAELYDLGHGLSAAEIDLEHATGMRGQVVGMGGRVVLMMGEPPVREQAAGITKAGANGTLFVNAQWSNLAHEWFHVLDFTAAQNVLSSSGVASLSTQVQPLRMTKNRVVFNAWSQSLLDLQMTSPRWQQERVRRMKEEMGAREALDESRSVSEGSISSPDYNHQYWVSPEEGMAYAFQAFVSDGNPVVLKGRIYEQESFRMPSPDEVKMQHGIWKRLFSALSPMELTKPMQVAPKPGERARASLH